MMRMLYTRVTNLSPPEAPKTEAHMSKVVEETLNYARRYKEWLKTDLQWVESTISRLEHHATREGEVDRTLIRREFVARGHQTPHATAKIAPVELRAQLANLKESRGADLLVQEVARSPSPTRPPLSPPARKRRRSTSRSRRNNSSAAPAKRVDRRPSDLRERLSHSNARARRSPSPRRLPRSDDREHRGSKPSARHEFSYSRTRPSPERRRSRSKSPYVSSRQRPPKKGCPTYRRMEQHEETAVVEYVEDPEPESGYGGSRPGCSSWGSSNQTPPWASSRPMTLRERLTMRTPFDDSDSEDPEVVFERKTGGPDGYEFDYGSD